MLTPRQDYILIEPDKARERSEGGIYLPQDARDQPQQGTVLAVGPGRTNEDGKLVPISDIVEGYVVLHKKYGGQDIEIDGRKLLLVKESDVIAIMPVPCHIERRVDSKGNVVERKLKRPC